VGDNWAVLYMVINGLTLATPYSITVNLGNITALGSKQKRHKNVQLNKGEIQNLKSVDNFPPFQTQHLD